MYVSVNTFLLYGDDDNVDDNVDDDHNDDVENVND